ncbi:uncharacterized protein LOC128990142 [Macrosteles quadrilineatus]|uniref:uncharacterized protein LOC128990099 n=1 Tax=Macrosteles quadrilineatus TaxID=74068 RepID=UPI0023E21C8A|nr:uncharacterized protein LOC128990099 [Macrosteles quadrilineatus]XP_054268381.1 uncharacterized protein LOC128990142 [Macrosteles quadrilineatus]
MDPANIKTDPGLLSVEYYMNRLIQRAIIEAKPLLKIYEEECQRHPDISMTVSFKEFQTALQKHCMTLQTRQQSPAANQMKPQEQPTRYSASNESLNQRKRRRNSDMQSQAYHRAQQPGLDRYSPQASQMSNNQRYRPTSQQSAPINVKTEDPSYSMAPTMPSPSYSNRTTPVAAMQSPGYPTSRPPSIQPPAEEDPPPEFIEMSSNPPRLSGPSQYSNVFQTLGATEQSSGSDVMCKTEPKKSDGTSTEQSAVQSSSPLDKSANLCLDNVSPLNVRCVKCITALVTCAVMPCGHCCLCSICGQTVLSLKQVCPVCRKSITNVLGYSNLIYNLYR